MEECEKVLQILFMHEEPSGQKVNRSKTSLLFSKAIHIEVKHAIKEALGVPKIMQYEKYLGLLSFVGREKKASFNYIKERMWRKLHGCESQLLSQARREVLLKEIIQAIPTYTMGCFKIPISLCNEIETLFKRFWWGQRSEQRKIHWVKWEDMTKAKSIGGMGFKDLALFNDSLLAKQAWRLVHTKTSLFYKVFKERFFPNTSIMEAADSRMGSYAWKSILRGREVIQRGAMWRVGSGEKIYIWQERWLPRKHPPFCLSCPLESFENATVNCLIDPTTRTWNKELTDSIFVPTNAEEILKISLSRAAGEDILFWPYTPNGNYTCKSGYRFLKEASDQIEVASDQIKKTLWKTVWSMKTPHKLKNFIWRACRNAIPTKQALVRRIIIMNSLCERCRNAVEDPLHALWSCSELNGVWTKQCWGFRTVVNYMNFKELLSWLIVERKPLDLSAAVAWSIWNQRNKVRIQAQAQPLHQLAEQAKKWLTEFHTNSQAENFQPRQRSPRSATRWHPPPPNFVKINFDGAVLLDGNCSGLGVIIKDQHNSVMALCSKKLPQAYKAEEVEMLAATLALSFASELGFQQGVLEGDAMVVIEAMKAVESPLTPLGLLVDDAKELARNFDQLLYSHVKRDGSSVAHSLAKNALRISDFLVWMEDVSPHIIFVLQTDVMHLQ